MESIEIRKRFLEFFSSRGHAIIPSASLVPANDPSVLFTTAGMQPLVPYLLGQPHPQGTRLANVQKCVRTQDIDEVGDNTHDTFFEMMGNWSLGDYFKKEAISWSFELLTSKDEGFGLDPQRLYITVFAGDENAPKDEESYFIWKDIFEKKNISGERIHYMGAKSNWWSAGDNGPCGPDTEMFYDVTGVLDKGLNKEEYLRADQEQKVVEIWNNVFMEYEKKDGKVVGRLQNKNVDTGAGLERLTMVLQGKDNIFDTDLFLPIMAVTKPMTYDLFKQRILTDHIRTAVFMITDGVIPSNTDRGYVLRRLIRRAVFVTKDKQINYDEVSALVDTVILVYQEIYESLAQKRFVIKKVIEEEVSKFTKTLESGLKEFEKGEDPFVLFTTYGFPFELTKELSRERGREINEKDFWKKFKEHKDLSRTSSVGMFKGGLANQSEKTVKLHTAHHLLLAALQEVLGKEVKQKGSNITEERLRIDFSFPRKLTSEEIQKAEGIVNNHIVLAHDVVRREMPRIEAESLGAEMEFGAKYPDIVSIYFIEDKSGNIISKEFCGGPHVENTSSLASIRDPEESSTKDKASQHFKILKEEAVSAGVRRIKATLV